MKHELKTKWNREKHDWFKVIWQWQFSVIPAIFPRVTFCTVFAFFISWLYQNGVNVSIPIQSSIVPSIVLGLLLVLPYLVLKLLALKLKILLVMILMIYL